MRTSNRKLPREINIGFVRDYRTGGTHNVLEVCSKDSGVRYVMAQDAETAKERDKYKLRAYLLQQKVDAQQSALEHGGKEMAEMEFGADHEHIDILIRGTWYGWLHPELAGAKPRHSIPELQQQLAEANATIERQGKLMDAVVEAKQKWDKAGWNDVPFWESIDAIAAHRRQGNE